MRILRLIFLMLLLPVVCLPARAVSNSADAPMCVYSWWCRRESHSRTKDENNAGLYFKLEAGWHIYWMNPGDAGEPRTFSGRCLSDYRRTFAVSRAEAFAPRPPDGLWLRGRSLLPSHVERGEEPQAGPVTLHAKVNWLVCREVCIPGKAELEVKRRVATEEGISEENADYGLFLRQLKANSYPQQLLRMPKRLSAHAHGPSAHHRNRPARAFRRIFPSDPDILDNPARKS